MTLRAALVGCGRIASGMADDPLMAGDIFTHAEAYVRSGATELVAVCDVDPGLARLCAERWGVGASYADVRAMLEEARPDIVSIATPDDTHFALARTILDHGPSVRALLCEKPLATSLDEAADLVALAETRGVVLAVAHLRRYADNFRALKALLDSGALGRIKGVTGWYTKGVLHNGVHWFDQLRMLAGEALWVEAIDCLSEPGPDPTIDVQLGLESGALATLRAGDMRDFTLFEMDLLTERGRVLIQDSGYRIDLFRAAPSPRYSNYVELEPMPTELGDRRDMMLHAVDDLAAAVRGGRPPACSGADGLAALRIGTAALKAATTRQRVGLGDGLPIMDR